MTRSVDPYVKPCTFSANADWVRALQRTSAILPGSSRTLAVVVTEGARKHGTRSALCGERDMLTYAALSARADRYARWGIAQNLKKGDRVAILMANQPDYAAVWIGLARIGVVTALLNTQLVEAGLAHCLALAEAKHLIVGAGYVEALSGMNCAGTCWTHGIDYPNWRRIDHVIEAIPDTPLQASEIGTEVTLQDPALLIYTSGTTGLPKGAHVSHYRIMMWSEWFAGVLDAKPDDRLFNCLPMYHSIGGVTAVGAMLVSGGAVVIRDGFSAHRFWPDVVTTGATIFQYIGELCRYLLSAPTDASTVSHKLRICVGNGLRPDVWERFATRFAIPRIIEFYASTEGSFSLFNLEERRGSIGRVPRFMAHRSPIALVEFDHETEKPVRDATGSCRRCRPGFIGEAIGMISREATNLSMRFEGYTSESETQRKILHDVFESGDMWFRTGDLMRQDSAGFFYFVDRIGDTFRWKGENVSTSEVSAAIGMCDGIHEVAVYGVTVPHTDGRAGMAALSTTRDFELCRFRTQLASQLPRFARPVFLRICDKLIATSTFKFKKQYLAREGFDPSIVLDAIFFDDPACNAYRPIDGTDFEKIISGEMKV